MKVQLLSDLHMEFAKHQYQATDADVVILAGDIHVGILGVLWAIETIQDKPVIYVMGNHEYYYHSCPQLLTSIKQISAGTNVHVLNDSCFTIDDVNFLGSTLWTDFAALGDRYLAIEYCQNYLNDFQLITYDGVNARLPYAQMTPRDLINLHEYSKQWLGKQLNDLQGQQNVVVTHHGPSLASLPVDKANHLLSAAYVSELTHFIEQYKPLIWMHGHVHHSCDYTIGGCRVVCNPRGYTQVENPQFDAGCCFEL